MKAARLHEYTDDPSSAFTIEDVDPPEIETPHDVVVDVEGAGWCHTDNHILEGDFESIADHELPYTPGHENAGTVAEVGSEVTLVSPGDTVVVYPQMTCGVCRACRSGEDMFCPEGAMVGIDVDGGFAEQLRTVERSVVPLDSLDPVEAAPHADAGITAYNAVKKASRKLEPGDVAVLVGMGGLGHIGLQALRAISPARTIAVDVKESALELAERCGADHTINSAEEDVPAVVEDVTDGRMARKVLDFVRDEDTLGLGPAVLAPGGDHHVVGYEGQLDVPAVALVGGEIDYRGTLVGTYTELQELIDLAERGLVEVEYSTFELADVNEIAQRLHDGEVHGRAVFTP